MPEFVSFDQAVLGVTSLGPATFRALEVTIIKLAPMLEKKVKQKIGQTIGSSDPKYGWPPLSPETIEKKKQLGLGKGGDPTSMLYATGQFFRSIKVTVDRKNLGIHIGSDVQHAIYTEFGTATQPARPVFRPVAKEVGEEFKPIFFAAVEEEYSLAWSRARRTRYSYQVPWLGIEETIEGSRAPMVGTFRYHKSRD